MNTDIMAASYLALRERLPDARPVCGLILGSGLSAAADAVDVRDTVSYGHVPCLGESGVPGHAGKIVWGNLAGLETLVFSGRRHFYEGAGWEPVAAPIYLLKRFGVRAVMLTNAAGSMRESLCPGDIMIIDDHINAMGSSPLIGVHDLFWGPRFPDQSQVYNVELRHLLDVAAQTAAQTVKHGIYLATSGPAYETPAEIEMLRAMGGDAVGMSTVPEATLAHAAGLRVAGLSCITNASSGTGGLISHEEVIATTASSIPRVRKLIELFWRELSDRPELLL